MFNVLVKSFKFYFHMKKDKFHHCPKFQTKSVLQVEEWLHFFLKGACCHCAVELFDCLLEWLLGAEGA